VAGFGTHGMDLELKLLLITGQTEKVRSWMEPRQEELLDAYHWNKLQLAAAIGNYADADGELDFLADYIMNTHHKYVVKALPVIFEYTQKVAKVHGDRHPEAIEIVKDFLKVADELNRHMMKEEMMLFPYIVRMEEAVIQHDPILPPPFGSLSTWSGRRHSAHGGRWPCLVIIVYRIFWYKNLTFCIPFCILESPDFRKISIIIRF